LARRLRNMVAVDEGIFVDPDYISHAEYQIFLEEKRGLGRYHQPDHWQGVRFPEGHASAPAAGIRSSDAASFCEWLSARDGDFVFRLPATGEIEHYRLGVTQNSSGNIVGFWTTHEFERIGLFPNLPTDYLSFLFFRDLTEEGSALDRDLARALDHALDRALDLALSLDFDLDRDSDRPLDLHRAFDVSLACDLARDLTLAINLDLDLDRARDRACDLDRVLNLHRDLDLDCALSCARDRARDLARDHDRTRDLAGARARARNRNHELNFIDRSRLYQEIRWFWRVFSLSLATLPNYSPKTGFRGLFKSEGEIKMANYFREPWLSLYGSLVLLEARIDGVVPAVEGIRIIKERRL